MDGELKQYLVGMEERFDAKLGGLEKRMDTKLDGLEQRMGANLDRAAETFAGEIGSLHTEISRLRADVNERLELVNERLDRQGFMLSGGTQALVGLLGQVTNFHIGNRQVLSQQNKDAA